MRKATLPAMLLAGLAAVSAYAQTSFGLHVPDGWINLTDRGANVDKIPPHVVDLARSGRYVVYAVDPAAVDSIGAKVSFNAVEEPKTGTITNGVLRRTAAEMSAQMQGTQFSVAVTNTRLEQLDGVTIGVMESMMETPRGPMRLLQYVIPGKEHAAVLTYGCPPGDYDRYLPIFQASAKATTGAYDHALINWRAVLLAGILGGIIAAVLASIAILQRKKPAPVAAAAAVPMTWECPACKRRVPLRIDACRCGAPRPAVG